MELARPRLPTFGGMQSSPLTRKAVEFIARYMGKTNPGDMGTIL